VKAFRPNFTDILNKFQLRTYGCECNMGSFCIESKNLAQNVQIIFLHYQPIPWRDSISQPITPVASVAVGDELTR
jgi:hypothetical protein